MAKKKAEHLPELGETLIDPTQMMQMPQY